MCPITKAGAFLRGLIPSFTKKKAAQGAGFRCPFEVKGEEEETITDVSLNEIREERLLAINKGLEKFHINRSSPGLRFTLPKTLLNSCSSNEELRSAILPYQTEILAADLDYRLQPFLPYQLKKMDKEKAYELFKKDPYRAQAAYLLIKVMGELGFPAPKNASDIADWILMTMMGIIHSGITEPVINIIDFDRETKPIYFIRISPGQTIIYAESNESRIDPRNRNCFGIVKTPFYPKTFGRWSEQVEIVMSREADFVALPKEVRRKIRRASNTVLQQNGIQITDFDNDKPEGEGLWIPIYQ